MDCIVHGVSKSQTRLNDFHFTSCKHQSRCSGQQQVNRTDRVLALMVLTFSWGKIIVLECTANIYRAYNHVTDFPGGSDGKASVYNAGDPGLIPGWGRSPGEGNGNPLQYSCLENPMDGGDL